MNLRLPNFDKINWSIPIKVVRLSLLHIHYIWHFLYPRPKNDSQPQDPGRLRCYNRKRTQKLSAHMCMCMCACNIVRLANFLLVILPSYCSWQGTFLQIQYHHNLIWRCTQSPRKEKKKFHSSMIPPRQRGPQLKSVCMRIIFILKYEMFPD